MPARLQGGPHRGFRRGRLHDRGPARLSDPPHQIHGLSYVADGFACRALRPCGVDAGPRDAARVPAAARRPRAIPGRFLAPQRCHTSGISGKTGSKRTTVEIQQAIRFNLFHILQASARREHAGVPAKGLTGQAYEGLYFWDTELPAAVSEVYLPRTAKNLLTFRTALEPSDFVARTRAAECMAYVPYDEKTGIYPQDVVF